MRKNYLLIIERFNHLIERNLAKKSLVIPLFTSILILFSIIWYQMEGKYPNQIVSPHAKQSNYGGIILIFGGILALIFLLIGLIKIAITPKNTKEDKTYK